MKMYKNFIYLNIICRIEVTQHTTEPKFLIEMKIPQYNLNTILECEYKELMSKLEEVTEDAKQIINEKECTIHLSEFVIILMKDNFEVLY